MPISSGQRTLKFIRRIGSRSRLSLLTIQLKRFKMYKALNKHKACLPITFTSIAVAVAHWTRYIAQIRRVLSKRIPILPTEVCERVIDFVAEEFNQHPLWGLFGWKWDVDILDTLLSCALAYRAWTARSQWHLFRVLGAHCLPKGMEGGLKSLYSLIREHPFLQRHTEGLLVDGRNDTKSSMHTLPLNLPRLVTCLEHLRLSGGIFYLPSAAVVTMRQFITITKLSLVNITFPSPQDLRRTVGALQGLQQLSIRSPIWRPTSSKATQPICYLPSRIRLTLLSIQAEVHSMQDDHLTSFIEWVAHTGVARSLLCVRFEMMILDTRMFTAVQSVITAAKDSLLWASLSWSTEVYMSPCKCMARLCLHATTNIYMY